MGAGQGTGLSPYSLGQTGGAENVTLTTSTIASHTHQATSLSATVPGVNTTGTTNQPSPSVVLAAPTDAARNPVNIYSNAAANQNLGPGTVTGSVAPAGGGQPHLNLQPYQALNYIVALVGIYPLAKLAWIAHSPLNRSFAWQTFGDHVHHQVTFETAGEGQAVFCRITQLALLRHLTS